MATGSELRRRTNKLYIFIVLFGLPFMVVVEKCTDIEDIIASSFSKILSSTTTMNHNERGGISGRARLFRSII